MIIAVDGPAAAGKGTLARALATHFGYHFLDTGSLYRMAARVLIDSGIDPSDSGAAIAAAEALDPARYGGDDLRTEEVADVASVISVNPGVRAALLAFQRDFARQPPGAVLDGRDIGTVVCPGAEVKIYVTAAPEVRARRRAQELEELGKPQAFDSVLADIRARDARDRTRATAPLVPAADAHILDTSALSISEAITAAVTLAGRDRKARSA
ncbi:(d)CMP kinase [soil metagenome]